MSNRVMIASAIWILSDCCCLAVIGWTLHCAAGRDLKDLSLLMTYMLITDPSTAMIIIGTLIRAAWIEKMNLGMIEAAASEFNPITRRNPLTAKTAAQALCSNINAKLVNPASQEPRLNERRSLDASRCVSISPRPIASIKSSSLVSGRNCFKFSYKMRGALFLILVVTLARMLVPCLLRTCISIAKICRPQSLRARRGSDLVRQL